jgi:hypothetical protein
VPGERSSEAARWFGGLPARALTDRSTRTSKKGRSAALAPGIWRGGAPRVGVRPPREARTAPPEARATKRPPRSSPRASRRQPRLPRTEAPEYHNVAVQQHARREFGAVLHFKAYPRAGLGAGKCGRGAWHPGQGPAARGGHLRRPPLARRWRLARADSTCVFAPVECSQGRHCWIAADCRARRSEVQPFASVARHCNPLII